MVWVVLHRRGGADVLPDPKPSFLTAFIKSAGNLKASLNLLLLLNLPLISHTMTISFVPWR